MSRVPVAVVGGLLAFAAYVAVVVALGDRVAGANWAVQALYFVVVGTVWVLPARWLMLWSVHQR